jgi:hypothetical protein
MEETGPLQIIIKRIGDIDPFSPTNTKPTKSESHPRSVPVASFAHLTQELSLWISKGKGPTVDQIPFN